MNRFGCIYKKKMTPYFQDSFCSLFLLILINRDLMQPLWLLFQVVCRFKISKLFLDTGKDCLIEACNFKGNHFDKRKSMLDPDKRLAHQITEIHLNIIGIYLDVDKIKDATLSPYPLFWYISLLDLLI